jgi:lipopolysaccharide export system ATP-binding protein
MGLLEKCIAASGQGEDSSGIPGSFLQRAAAARVKAPPPEPQPVPVAEAIPLPRIKTPLPEPLPVPVAEAKTPPRVKAPLPEPQPELEKLRLKKKSGEESVTNYIDRRQTPRDSDRRSSRRNTEGYNTLTIIDLRKNFGSKEIVRGVGFSMKGGDVAGLLGPNGAGKTTIFYMIVGFYKPTTGDIKLNDVSIVNRPMYRRARMGIAYLPQEASIFRKLTVEQNIWAILESRKDLTKKHRKQRLDELISDFSIGRIRKQPGYTLSGGERRRTEIARALAIDPKFLLLDEPFAGIDPIAVYEIKQIIQRLSQKGIGILITDHNVRDTLEITTDAFIINQGLIVARGSRESILSNQTVRDVYLGSEFRM